MSFSFDFSGDDIGHGSDQDMEDALALASPAQQPKTSNEADVSNVRLARKESLTDLLSSLPSRISYTTLLVTSPKRACKVLVPRRALFDVKMQIMAESNDDANLPASGPKTSQNSQPSKGTTDIGLGDSDIEQDVYEGGFKSWEGAVDLAQLLLDRETERHRGGSSDLTCVLELGCGTAIPTIILFEHALATNLAFNFTLADYNDSVLRLVTLPNLLLTWAVQHTPESFSPQIPSLFDSSGSTDIRDSEGDLEITPALVEAFVSNLTQRNINFTFISGPWSPSPHFTSLITPDPNHRLLILAAETIYSLQALRSFTSALVAVLKSVEHGRALVAAKRMYFGVGGSVDEFIRSVAGAGGLVAEIDDSGIVGCDRSLIQGSGGVGRWLGVVQLP